MTIKGFQRVFFLAFSLLTFAAGALEGRSIVVMNYNLQNLFDTLHDPGKEDFAFLPLAYKNASPEVQTYCAAQTDHWRRKECFELDWTEAKLKMKFKAIGIALRSMNQGRGPDILVVEEVENLRVLTQLRDSALKDLGYQSVVLIEGPDKRGIDVGVLSRLPVTASRLHPVVLSDVNTYLRSHPSAFSNEPMSSVTRGILELRFQVGPQRFITLFGNHWPSQESPDAYRMKAGKVLAYAALEAERRGDLVMISGDFNTSRDDKENGMVSWLMNPNAPAPAFDSTTVYLSEYNSKLPLWPGSMFAQGHWEHLDRILFLQKAVKDHLWEPNFASYRVHAPPLLLDKQGHPFRFDPATGTGFSDHLPVYIQVKF